MRLEKGFYTNRKRPRRKKRSVLVRKDSELRRHDLHSNTKAEIHALHLVFDCKAYFGISALKYWFCLTLQDISVLFHRPNAWDIPLSSDVYFATLSHQHLHKSQRIQLLQGAQIPSIRHRSKFIFVLIILTSLTLEQNFFWILLVFTRLVRMIRIKARE